MTKHQKVEVEVEVVELAVSRPERDRWPDEPQERDEPDQDERERELALFPVSEEDLHEKFDSEDRSTGRGGGWSTKIVRDDDGA